MDYFPAFLDLRERSAEHVLAEIDYLGRSHHPDTRDEFDAEQAEQWATRSNWKRKDSSCPICTSDNRDS